MPVADKSEDDDDGRIGSGTTSSQRLQAHEVSIEEYNDLAKRLDSMESSVGFVLNKVCKENEKLFGFLK
jgi:hypothetical protein